MASDRTAPGCGLCWFTGFIGGAVVAALIVAPTLGTTRVDMFFKLLPPIVTLFALLFGVHQYRRGLEQAESRHRFESARDALWKGVETLTPKSGMYPPQDRVLWIRAARFLEYAEREAATLVPVDRGVYEYEKAKVRAQLKTMLEPLNGAPGTYFAEDKTKWNVWSPEDRAPLSEHSLKVIFDWISDEGEDVLSKAGRLTFSEADRERLELWYWKGLARLLDQYDGWLESLKEKNTPPKPGL